MVEFIEREAARDLLDMALADDWEIEYANDRLDEIPVADVRPVVLCKDCEHSEPWYSDKSRCFLWSESGIDVFNDGFCSYGRKKAEI